MTVVLWSCAGFSTLSAVVGFVMARQYWGVVVSLLCLAFWIRRSELSCNLALAGHALMAVVLLLLRAPFALSCFVVLGALAAYDLRVFLTDNRDLARLRLKALGVTLLAGFFLASVSSQLRMNLSFFTFLWFLLGTLLALRLAIRSMD